MTATTMTIPAASDANDKLFTIDKAFWNNYLKGRPSAPSCFFERIFQYHHSHGGIFNTIHDVGAGNGPYATKLRSKFQHVIVSDIAPENVALAKDRLGTDGFTYRAARVEQADDIPDGSVDMVFATNVMHFCDQEKAMKASAQQLRPGGTFACAAFGAARFEDPKVHELYTRICQTGARALLKKLDSSRHLIEAMARTKGPYNVAPLDEALFLPGAKRIHLNFPEEGMTSPLPPEIAIDEPWYTGANDVEVWEQEEGWSFVTDMSGVREHVASFPFAKDGSEDLESFWREMEDVAGQKPIEGHWPAKIILATRR